jgi:hypothetical protein
VLTRTDTTCVVNFSSWRLHTYITYGKGCHSLAKIKSSCCCFESFSLMTMAFANVGKAGSRSGSLLYGHHQMFLSPFFSFAFSSLY